MVEADAKRKADEEAKRKAEDDRKKAIARKKAEDERKKRAEEKAKKRFDDVALLVRRVEGTAGRPAFSLEQTTGEPLLALLRLPYRPAPG